MGLGTWTFQFRTSSGPGGTMEPRPSCFFLILVFVLQEFLESFR